MIDDGDGHGSSDDSVNDDWRIFQIYPRVAAADDYDGDP